MTKIVTATAALRLADEGRLDLHAPVGEYLDYLRAPGGPNRASGSSSVTPPVSAIRCPSVGSTPQLLLRATLTVCSAA